MSFKSNARLCPSALCIVVATAAVLAGCASVSAPAKGSRTVLQHEVYPSGYEVNVIRIVLPANTNSPHHEHPGLESGYIARGSVTISIDGQAEHVLRAGDTFETPAYAPHIVKNGPAETEIISTYITETGKPVTKALP
ncbi:cupin domain-containing protein [Pseudomonas syringae]|uniref:cupin domain-containing protein n=1 Tax=Pseudomonas syringae TaxID=317 RepID=UPI0009B53202|nr:cupin domain-containing protein [Pseudomonas syringae]